MPDLIILTATCPPSAARVGLLDVDDPYHMRDERGIAFLVELERSSHALVIGRPQRVAHGGAVAAARALDRRDRDIGGVERLGVNGIWRRVVGLAHQRDDGLPGPQVRRGRRAEPGGGVTAL